MLYQASLFTSTFLYPSSQWTYISLAYARKNRKYSYLHIYSQENCWFDFLCWISLWFMVLGTKANIIFEPFLDHNSKKSLRTFSKFPADKKEIIEFLCDDEHYKSQVTIEIYLSTSEQETNEVSSSSKKRCQNRFVTQFKDQLSHVIEYKVLRSETFLKVSKSLFLSRRRTSKNK